MKNLLIAEKGDFQSFPHDAKEVLWDLGYNYRQFPKTGQSGSVKEHRIHIVLI